MSDYISREKALNALGEQPLNWNDSEVSIAERAMWEEHKTAIENIPSENVKPVVYGKWVYNENGMDFNLGAWKCNKCGCRNNNLPVTKRINPLIFSGSNFCPNCGADMRGDGRA